MKKYIYMDNSATTPVKQEVIDEILPYFNTQYGNPSSIYTLGGQSKNVVEISREKISKVLNINSNEIFFTAGGSESDNWALKGIAFANREKGNHIITVKTEHKAVLATCEYLETKGFEVTYLDVDENGLILMDQLRDSVKDNTLLVVIMYVNNETGVIQPINEIGEFCKERDIAFFCDATQAIGKVKVDVEKDNIDVLCFSGHKINGPKGIGVLYKKEHMAITPLIHGGGQEKGMRGGTYNTPLIVGLGEACELSLKEFEKNTFNLIKRRTEIEEYYEANNIGSVNFKTVNRAPHIISITLKDYEADEYLMLKSREFVASTGSACNARIVEPSHVFREIKLKNIESIIRLSI